METPLSEDEKRTLLKLAREALERTVRGEKIGPINLSVLSPRLRAPGASFVTLSQAGNLRGCIGTLKRQLPLAEDVRQHAIAAARHDYRFPPVKPDELDDIKIELSILTKPQALNYSDSESLLTMIRSGIDGVIVTCGKNRATFLPQVWEKVPDTETFLGMLCEKAFLPREAWRQGNIEILTYQVESFHESPSTTQAE
jgi:AmmeMemoRadiSam system protein A